MEWIEIGIVLSARRLGESGAVVSLLTEGHGRHGGLVAGGGARGARAVLQPGNRVQARWRARLAEQLGSFACELVQPLAPRVLADRGRLAAVSAACALVETALPEREPLPRLFDGLAALIEAAEADADAAAPAGWRSAYVRFEVAMLAELGYGLDLRRCTVTGGTDDLAYVSPRTGRAVSTPAAGAWADRLLALPAFLLDPEAGADDGAFAAGLVLTGHFLQRHVFGERGRPLPPARQRLQALSHGESPVSPGPLRQGSSRAGLARTREPAGR